MVYIFLITIFLFIVVGYVITRIWGIVRSIFSFGKNKKEENTTSSSKKSAQKRTKIFSKSEGEYVDYEEVK